MSMDPETPDEAPLHAGNLGLVGGALCLDFVNTVEPRFGTPHREYLNSYRDLTIWSQHAAILDEHSAELLLAEAEQNPRAAQQALDQAIKLREAIFRAFHTISQQQTVNNDDLAVINTAFEQAMSHAGVVPAGEGFEMTWAGSSTDLTRPVWPVAQSAVELLLHGNPERIKACPSNEGGCEWLFYDTSKNNSRRWCSMKDCGTDAKERRRAKRGRAQ